VRLLAFLGVVFILAGCGGKPQPIYSAGDQFTYAKNLYDKGKYNKAQIAFENLIYSYPGNSVIDTAQYYMAMSYYQQKEYSLAAGEFKRLLSAYPRSQFADDSQFQIGMCHYKMSPKYELDQSETHEAISEFQTLISEYPASAYMADAQVRIKELEDKLAQKAFKTGELYLKLRDYESALVYFSYVRDNYPSTDWAIKSYYYTGETYLKLERYDEALEIFQNFLNGFANHDLTPRAKERIEKINKLNNNDQS
jgi:outer membrane protein assembly factor BamD